MDAYVQRLLQDDSSTTVETKFEGTVIDCLRKSTYYFCNPNNVPVGEGGDYADQKQGWCCPPGSTDSDCTNVEGTNDCTEGDYEEIGLPLYNTYWMGMTPEICGVESKQLVATTQ